MTTGAVATGDGSGADDMPTTDVRGGDDRRDTPPQEAKAAAGQRAATGAVELTGRLTSWPLVPHPDGSLQRSAHRTRFIVTADLPRDALEMYVQLPFDPTITYHVALTVADLTCDRTWIERLEARGLDIQGRGPVQFRVSFDPNTEIITVKPDGRCTLPLLHMGAREVARVCKDAAFRD